MYKFFLKRVFDFIFALLLLVILLFPFFLIAIIIKLDSNGPVFYRQFRLGKKLTYFRIYKFRSMVLEADKLGGFSTQVNDPRVTKIGKYIRKTSVDELPQLINILSGDMSFIGPRPDVKAQIVNYSDIELIERHQVKPGLTGLSQARNRHFLSNINRKRYDIFYNRKVSFQLDFKIILWTLKSLKKGSY